MNLKPLPGLLRHFFQCSRFFEQMCRTRDNRQSLRTAEELVGLLIHFDDGVVFAADQEQSRCGHLRQIAFCKVRTSAA